MAAATGKGESVFVFGVLGLTLFLVAIILAVLGVHALLLGRIPSRKLQRRVRQPRLWGAGILLTLASGNFRSPSLLAIGIGLIALGYAVKPMR